MPFFDEEMPEIKLGDLDNIPCASRQVGGGRAIVARRYPNRDGQASEDLGREPYTFELEIPLFADIDPDHYPTMADELRLILESPPDRLEYRDHEYGTMNVSIGPWTSEMDAQRRDGVLFRIHLTEDDLDISNSFRELVTAPDVESVGNDLDEALEAAGVDEDALKKKLDKAGVGLKSSEQGFTAGSMWSNQGLQFSNRLRDGVQTAEQIAADVDTVRGRVDVVLGLPEALDPAHADIMNAAILFADAVGRLGDAQISGAALIVEETIATTTSVFEVAMRLYGSADRAAEIMARNPLVDPMFIVAGTVLQVAA